MGLMGLENAKSNLGDTNLNIPQPVFRNMLQNHINPNKKHYKHYESISPIL